MEENQTFIIVGWGIAGATLAWKLNAKDISFTVIDSGHNHSSRTAAGLVNPIVFKRLTKSWKADVLMPAAFHFYERLETVLHRQLLSRKSIKRVFASFEEQNNWSSLLGDERFKPYLEEIENTELPNMDTPFGTGAVKTFGNLDTNLFLDASKSYFLGQGVEFRSETFDYTVEDDENYIFCEGVGIKMNPFFNYLPLKPTHGETLIIRSEELVVNDIINKNMFVLPLGNHLFKIGATYNWDLQEPITTENGKDELLEKLNSFVHVKFKVVDHQAGIRPTVSDRRPLIGTHPIRKNIHVFNGLGTKGVMIAPFFADHFVSYLTDGRPLEPEVDIKRYSDLYNG